ncbi:MAG: hypothetical protein AAFY66_11235 [Pseudomonadota bacterium]
MFNEQIATATKAMETWQKPAKEAFHLWVSFFPVAPFFGVEWRFADSMQVPNAAAPFMPAATPTAKPAPKPAAKPAATLKVVETKPVKVEAPKPKPVARAEPTPKVAAPKPGPKQAPKPSAKAAAPKAEAPKAAPKPAVKAVAKTEAPKAAAKAETPKPAPKAAPKPVAQAAQKVEAPKVEAPKAESPKVAVAKPAAPKRAADGRPTSLLASAPVKPDDLKLIKGIGPSLEKQLNGLGIYKFEQIAEFDDKALAWVDDNLTAFKGRCFRDDWVGQAKTQLG